jgi:cytoskeletal protein RodZ
MRELGHLLREARLSHNLDLSEVAQKTHISGHYLVAMEEGRFHVIPKVYDRGYLKIYARLLKMDVPPILDLYDRMRTEAAVQQSEPLD